MWRRVLLALFGVLSLGLGDGAAHAQEEGALPEAGEAQSSVAVVIDAADADLFVESLVRTTVEDALKKLGHEIFVDKSVGGDTPQKLLACSGELTCTVSVLSIFPVDEIFFLSLRAEESGEDLNLKIVARSIDRQTGRVKLRTMKRCSSCQEGDHLGRFVQELIEALRQGKKAPATIAKAEQVKPAVVTKPDAPVTGPASRESGYGKVAALDGRAATRVVREPASEDDGSLGRRMAIAGFGVGVAGLVGGVSLLAIDGPVVEDGVRQRDAYDTKEAGLYLLGGSAVALGATLLYFVLSDSSDEESNYRLGMKINGDSVGMSYGGRF